MSMKAYPRTPEPPCSRITQDNLTVFLRYLTDLTSNKAKTIGLIQSTWGMTGIEAWSSRKALDRCQVPPTPPPYNTQQQDKDSSLWNAMVHPYLRHGIRGAMWYQGKVAKLIRKQDGNHQMDLQWWKQLITIRHWW